MPVEIAALSLCAREDRLGELRHFYLERLGLHAGDGEQDGVCLGLRRARLTFAPATGDPFYHFALLLPGNRFEAAAEWAATRVELLKAEDGSTVFEFERWPARAVYFIDPAENIVELIAHPGVETSPADGSPFDAQEIVGISEAGLVAANPEAAARSLSAIASLPVWDSDPADGIAFLGRRAHTVIVCAAGRGWLPTRRPAEAHPASVMVRTDGVETRIVADQAGAVRVEGAAS